MPIRQYRALIECVAGRLVIASHEVGDCEARKKPRIAVGADGPGVEG